MANARERKVLSKLVDLASYQNYVIDRFNDVGEPLGRGDTLVIPNIGALTVYADGSVARDNSDRNNPSPTELTLTINQEPFIPVQLPQVSSIENLAGNWDTNIADQVMIQMRNYLDGLILDYLTGVVAWTNVAVTAGSVTDLTAYQTNTAADTLIPPDFLLARGILSRLPGTFKQNLLWIVDPLASAAIMGFPGWQNQMTNDFFGADTIGRVYGIEVVESQGLRTGKTFSTLTAAVVASNVATLTFSSNPGLVPGGPITTAGLTTNITDIPVTTVSSDGLSLTVPLTASNGSVFAGGATVYENAAVNLLVDRTHVYTAFQKVPSIRMMPDPKTTGDILQASALLGYLARAGRVRAIRSPDTFI